MDAGKLWCLRRLADDAGRFKMLAVDQRPPIQRLVAAARGEAEARVADVAAVKRLLTEVLSPAASAVLMDPAGAYPHAIDVLSPRKGLLVTLEDSAFAETPGGRKSRAIPHWNVGKIKRLGADGVKVLAWYRPDAAPDVVAHQQAFVEDVGRACQALDIAFVLELLHYALPGEAEATIDTVEHAKMRPQMVIDSVAAFAGPRFGVDLFKLESPIPAADLPDPLAGGDSADIVQAWFDALGEAAGRPWVMLSAGAAMGEFERVLTYAYRAGASGYLAGRAIWLEALAAFPDLARSADSLRADGLPYMARINVLTDNAAQPMAATETPNLAEQGAAFPESCADLS